ncbi:hypothetical protein BGZ49_006131 [Haplosporangium sp. Z 27]|nr:hypothetical protein BGZ49_006131 [Haplosporangium sp. Z 27]
MHPAAGLGALSAMNDAVILANYINTLETIESEDVEKALKAYKDERYPIAKTSFKSSVSMANTLNQGYSGKFIRYILNHLPGWLWTAILSSTFRCRPQISFLPPVDDKYVVKPMHQPSLEKTRPPNMARDV